MFFQICAYYLGCAARNRLLGTLKRLRKPKYLVGIIAIAAYIWKFFIDGPPLAGRLDIVDQREMTVVGLALMSLMQIGPAWLNGGRGLAFKEADVQVLFPRPLTRFQLLMFKLVTSQIAVIVSALIFGMIIVRGGAVSFVSFVAGFWLLQLVTTSHMLLAGLIRAQFKSILRFVPGILLLSTIPICAVLAWQSAGDLTSFDDVLGDLLAITRTEPLGTLLAPFKLLAAPAVTSSPGAFALAALVPLGTIVIHLLVIWLTKLPFEEQAIEIAAKLQSVRLNGLRGAKSKKKLVLAKPGSPWELAPTGPIWKALVWKNVISITRFSGRTLLQVSGVIFMVAYLIQTQAGDLFGGVGATRVGWAVLVIVAYMSFLGPALVRVDLRIDIPHFDVLKSMPLRARSLIFGEIMGTVVVLWAIQVVGCIVAAIFIVEAEDHIFSWDIKGPVLLAVLTGLLAFNFVLLTTENLIALWMPSFVRLGRGVKPSIDQMGPYILGALVKMSAIALLLIPAGLTGTAIGFVCIWAGLSKILAICIGVMFGAVVLSWAGFTVIQLSEKRYERFDITSERITAE